MEEAECATLRVLLNVRQLLSSLLKLTLNPHMIVEFQHVLIFQYNIMQIAWQKLQEQQLKSIHNTRSTHQAQ